MKMTTNIICLRVIIFLLILLPFEVECQKNAYGCLPYKPCRPAATSEFNCSDPQGLPCDEAYALIDVINGLKLPDSQPTNFSRKNCPDFSTKSITIKCYCNDSTTCHVTDIYTSRYTSSFVDMSDGIIHENVSKLLYLQSLDLSSNHLRCNISDSLGSLKALRVLDLSNNYLRGPIPPSLGNLTSLERLDLSNNYLWGPIPLSLGNFASLDILDLSGNMLSGEIPKELGKLSKLSTMNLEENELEGDLPRQLGNLNNLITLKVGSNYLHGVLPDEFCKLSSIQHFDVGGNSFHGPMPKFISKWNDLTTLDLTGNDFEGNLPPEIFEMSNLEKLWVSDLKSTQDFFFPNKMNLTNIETLVLRNCHIKGYIPNVIGNWPYISYLDLSFNNLSGPIPDSLQNVAEIRLTENMLSGQIPPWLDERRDFSYNYIQIPQNNSNYTTAAPNIWPNRNYTNNATKRHCDSLNQNLFINCGGRGNLTYEDKEYDEDTSREMFYESPNKKWGYTCSGMFQSEEYVGSSTYSTIKKKTCGVSDDGLQETARLCPISLTYYGFCLQNGNYSVKLQFAELGFANDEDYSSLKKRIFDVYIQGEKKLENFNIKNETGGKPYIAKTHEFVANVQDNQLVIKFYWTGKGSPYFNGPLVSAISVSPNFTISGEKKLSAGQITGITLGSVLAPILLLLLLWKMGCFRNREFQKVLIDVKGKNFTLQQIIDATRNFSPDMEIGKGRFGTVYKAELPNQIVLAVKKISPDLMQDKLKTELHGEIYNLKSLKQENLIELFGGYSKKELHLLIYEYMEKGSLHQAVLDPTPANVLDWKVRFDICLGLAKALKYLHEETRVTILHRNIKASNILLDGSYIPKLSDFGSAMLYNEEDPFITIKAGAARIYIAPEYAMGQPITVKADVYSYGVVVLEVFSGRPCIQYKTNDETAYLLDDGHTAHEQKRMDKLVDVKMVNYDRKVVLNTLNLAIMCIKSTANLRPTMSEVVSVLLGEKTIDEITKAHIS